MAFLQLLIRRPLPASERFALLSFWSILAITVLICGSAGLVLDREIVEHDGTVTGDLASLLFTSTVPPEFFRSPPGTDPPGAERLLEFARTKNVVSLLVYDADRRVLWSDDRAVIGRRLEEHPEVETALDGETRTEMIRPGSEEHHARLRDYPRLQEIYTPVRYRPDGPILGAIELYRDPPGLYATLQHGAFVVWVLGGVAGAVLYFVLTGVARSCSRAQARLEARLAREHEAGLLYQTTAHLGELSDDDALLKAIIQGAVALTHGSYGGVGFPDGDEMVLRRLIDTPERGPAVLRLKTAGCLAGLTFASGRPQVANDLERDERANRTSARLLGVRNLACVPLQYHGRIVGVLFVGNRTSGAFGEQDTVRLRAFAHHAAVAMENARLLRETTSTKEYLENLIASSVDAIVTLDGRGRVTFVNEGGRRMLGCGDAGLVGRPARALWTRGARDFRDFRARLLRCGRVQNHETELKAAGGPRLSVNISASFLRGPDGEITGVLAVIKDVTSLKRLHEQIVRSERLAAAGLLAAGIAHEVGNPLTCISSLAQVLVARTRDEAIRTGLESIEVHVDRISRIVQDLTRLTRPAPAALRDASVRELLDTAVQLARHNPVVRRMNVETIVEPGLPIVRVAHDHIVQVFLNLILNAADAGGHLTIHAVDVGDAVHVCFQDTGCGMTAEQMRWLFDPFHSSKDGETHLGLGLFVSHEIVRQHGGDLLVESEPGAGATVWVVLPLLPAIVPSEVPA